MRPSAPAVLLVGLLLLAIAVVAILSRSPLVLARTNGVPEAAEVAFVAPGAEICQGGEALPRGTSAIRLAINTGVGPSVELAVRSSGHLLASGTQSAGWRGASVTVALDQRVSVAAADTRVCASFGPSSEPIALVGEHSAPGVAATSNGRALAGRMQIEFLRPASGSWFTRAAGVAQRMGFGRAWSGNWVIFFVAALSATIVGLSTWIALRGLR